MVPGYKSYQKDVNIKKAHKCSFFCKFYEGKIPGKNWGQIHCDDVCSSTSKIITPQFVLHIIFLFNVGVRSRDWQKLQGRPSAVERCISLLEQSTPMQEGNRGTARDGCIQNGMGWYNTDVRDIWYMDQRYNIVIIQL